MLESEQLKEIFKSAIVELLRKNRSEMSALLSEIIEDIAIGKAIAEGENTELVSRESIFGLLSIAKIGVERAIKTDESTAIDWINQQLEDLGVLL
jgi:hypothetical protein